MAMAEHTLNRVASAIGAGLLAGVAGTAAMTVSNTLEARLRRREPSSTPSDAAGKVLGVQPRNPAGKARFSTVVHWSYGTAWGAARGLIGLAGLGDSAASAVHFTAVWGWSLVMLPALNVTPPPWQQPRAELAVDALHHAVYAGATTAAYRAFE
jgi:uncharacterized membrane protein YagU involved in acid resistance